MERIGRSPMKNTSPEMMETKNKRIATYICRGILALTIIAMLFLTVVVYIPFYTTSSSKINETPVMCTTIKTEVQDSCSWISCGEWCLSKGTGQCTQISVNIRNNGSSLLLANCTNIARKTCYGIDLHTARKYVCIKDECKNLTGTFNCTKGVCYNLTDGFDCKFQNTEPAVQCWGPRGKVRCMENHGMFKCNRGECEKVLLPYNCERRCLDIPTRNKNVVLLSGDQVYLARCSVARDSSTKKEVWNESDSDTTNILMASCFQVKSVPLSGELEALDCINGSVLTTRTLGDYTNFTFLSYLHAVEATLMPQIAPLDSDLTISNNSNLMINLEGCVNTLRDECKEFFRIYAKDGSDHNARARFPCFYSNLNKNLAVVRFDLETEYNQFMFAFLLPSILLIVSCLMLFFCRIQPKSGGDDVDDESNMKFKCLTEEIAQDANNAETRLDPSSLHFNL